MNTPRLSSRLRQRGIVTVVVVVFLITAVIFALSQTLGITGSNSIDNTKQLDSVAALFLAESGLERAMGILSASTSAGTMNGGVCTGIKDNETYTLGQGRNFKFVSANPSCASGTCSACTGANCTGCSVQVTGTVVGSASRTLNLDINLTSVNGTSGFGTNVILALRNTYDVPATSVFNLAWRRQGGTTGEVVAGGNATATASTGCVLRWNDESSSGSPSAGSMGASCDIGASPAIATVTQTISTDRNYAEVGALFPGLIILGVGVAPTNIGSYWDDTSGASGTKTVNNSGATPSRGETNSGVETSGSCTSATYSTGTKQSCTSWCYGGDTLVFGVSARSSSYTSEITAVTFNTSGSPLQNVALTPPRGNRIAHFPNTSGTPSSTGDIYSEIWYAYNPNLSPTPFASSASSYKGNGTGAIGAAWTGGGITCGVIGQPGNCAVGSTLFVGTFATGGNAYPANIISIGDTISSSGPGGITGSPTIVSQLTSAETGGALGGRGTYQLSSLQTVLPVNSRNWTATSNVLNVSACTICFFANGDALSGLIAGRTINNLQLALRTGEAAGRIGRYPISGAAIHVNSANTLRAGTPGATIYLPSTSSMPAVTTPATRVAIFSGPGTLAANTTVTAVPDPIFGTNPVTNSFTVSPAPTAALDLATICGGTCAFFDNPSSTSATTQFQVTRSAGTTQWAGGFTCLSGVDQSIISPVTSSSTSATTWSENVQ